MHPEDGRAHVPVGSEISPAAIEPRPIVHIGIHHPVQPARPMEMHRRAKAHHQVAGDGGGGPLECSDVPSGVVVGGEDDVGDTVEEDSFVGRNFSAVPDNMENMCLIARRKTLPRFSESLGQGVVGVDFGSGVDVDNGDVH